MREVETAWQKAYHQVMKCVRWLFLILTFFTLGCLSAHHPIGLAAIPTTGPVINAAVHLDAVPEKLSDIETEEKEAGIPPEQEKKQIHNSMEMVQDQIRESFSQQLSEKDGLAINWVDADHLETATAPLKLEITLSGYGRLKKKWITYMLASGVVEALFQGIVVASALNNTWAGVGVGVEELGSEWVTWHGGAWLFSRTFAPITLEGHMWRTGDGKLVWRKTVFVSKNKKELKKLPEKERDLREVRLAANLHKAENILLKDLTRYLKKENVIGDE
jgi:hypothetical protein